MLRGLHQRIVEECLTTTHVKRHQLYVIIHLWARAKLFVQLDAVSHDRKWIGAIHGHHVFDIQERRYAVVVGDLAYKYKASKNAYGPARKETLP